MANYKAMYTKLFNTVTDTISILQNVQIETEIIALDKPDGE